MEQQNTGSVSADFLPPQTLEVNPKHPLIVKLDKLRQQERQGAQGEGTSEGEAEGEAKGEAEGEAEGEAKGEAKGDLAKLVLEQLVRRFCASFLPF